MQCAKQTPPRTGRAIVVDYLNFPESRAVAEAMTQAGLQTTTLFNVAQATSYQCGDNAAAWACMLRQLGQHFTELTHDVASTINNPEYAHAQRRRLGKYRDDTMEAWLDGDEIVSLVMYDNPDAASTSPSWLSGPGPLNYFYTFFAQTLMEPKHRGLVRIMVVNTAVDSGIAPSVGLGGRHWFVVAWFVDPDTEVGGTSAMGKN